MLGTLETIHEQGASAGEGLNFIAKATERIRFRLCTERFADDAYMKMNARGLTLTQWENFKGAFADQLPDEIKNEWKEQVEALSNAFFVQAGQERLPDQAFFALMARALVYRYGSLASQPIPNVRALAAFTRFDDDLPFVPFEEFRALFSATDVGEKVKWVRSILQAMKVVLPSENNGLRSPYWDEKSDLFHSFFLPKNQNEADLSLALIEYAGKRGEAVSTDDLRGALRVMWNILENVAHGDAKHPYNRVEGIVAFIENGDARLLCGDAAKLGLSDNSPEQYREEAEKARQILSQSAPGEAEILEAESFAFFHGAIRFLYRNGTDAADWGSFAKKFVHAKKYFEAQGVQAAQARSLSQALIKSLDRVGGQFFDRQFFNSSKEIWKAFLLDRGLRRPIDAVLSADALGTIPARKFDDDNPAGRFQRVRNDLLSLDVSRNLYQESSVRWTAPVFGFYKHYGRDGFALDGGDFKRNELLRELVKRPGFQVNEQRNPRNGNLFFGWSACFTYQNQPFVWTAANEIFRADEGGAILKGADGKNTQPVNVTGVDSADGILQKLKNLMS